MRNDKRWDGPTKEQVARVAEIFETLAARVDAKVDFANPRIDHGQACGTLACHAGWYLVGVAQVPLDRRPNPSAGFSWTPSGVAGRMTLASLERAGASASFTEGRARMARALGFDETATLAEFAARHPEWWGNEHGARMFSSAGHAAFGFESGGGCANDGLRECTLADIARHWRAVAGRTPARAPGRSKHRSRDGMGMT